MIRSRRNKLCCFELAGPPQSLVLSEEIKQEQGVVEYKLPCWLLCVRLGKTNCWNFSPSSLLFISWKCNFAELSRQDSMSANLKQFAFYQIFDLAFSFKRGFYERGKKKVRVLRSCSKKTKEYTNRPQNKNQFLEWKVYALLAFHLPNKLGSFMNPQITPPEE